MIKCFVKNFLRPFNLEIRKIPDHEKKKFVWLKELEVKTIFDIGANIGQFYEEICKVLPDAYIYAFEPINDCYKKLQKRMKKHMNHKSFNFALGENDSEQYNFPQILDSPLSLVSL